jgi:hypothetical protein
MPDKAYQKAQQAYDRMEHPDYWDDPDEDEDRLEWDELSNDGQKRRMERNYEQADRRRKEIREDELIRSVRLPGDHDGQPSNEQMEYFKRGGR